MKNKIDLTELDNTKMFGFIYSIYAKEWLIDSPEYEMFEAEIEKTCILSDFQKRYLRAEWNIKEEILK